MSTVTKKVTKVAGRRVNQNKDKHQSIAPETPVVRTNVALSLDGKPPSATALASLHTEQLLADDARKNAPTDSKAIASTFNPPPKKDYPNKVPVKQTRQITQPRNRGLN